MAAAVFRLILRLVLAAQARACLGVAWGSLGGRRCSVAASQRRRVAGAARYLVRLFLTPLA